MNEHKELLKEFKVELQALRTELSNQRKINEEQKMEIEKLKIRYHNVKADEGRRIAKYRESVLNAFEIKYNQGSVNNNSTMKQNLFDIRANPTASNNRSFRNSDEADSVVRTTGLITPV